MLIIAISKSNKVDWDVHFFMMVIILFYLTRFLYRVGLDIITFFLQECLVAHTRWDTL